MLFRVSMSLCPRLITPTYPNRSGITRLQRISIASVPRSIKSSLVITPTVRRPSGSTSRAIWIASLFARSVFAAVTAMMMQLGWRMNFRTIRRMITSMSFGWSPTGTLRSIRNDRETE